MYHVFGADTETVKGRPLTFQLYDCDSGKEWIQWYKGGLFLTQFLTFLKPKIQPGKIAVIWIHNLNYDMGILFYPQLETLLNTKASFKINSIGFEGSFLYGRIHTLEGRFESGERIYLCDTFHFFPTSLKKLAKTFRIVERKIRKPIGLGTKTFKRGDRSFTEYALRDSLISGKVGNILIDYHKKFDVRLSISAPQFASRVFRHRFIPPETRIPFPRGWISEAALKSYHGGRNGCYVKPGVYKNVREIDITSAYPYAMTQIPNFLQCKYVATKKLVGGAIYNVRWTRQPEYPNLYGADNILRDTGQGWVTGYELLSARRFGANFSILQGYTVRTKHLYNPLAEYVKVMFAEKDKLDPKEPLYQFYKVGLLNSLYGKFIQSTERQEADIIHDENGYKQAEKVYTAGGLFNPFIASLITGHSRAYLHELENKYSALHSSTDSILTQKSFSPVSGLGGLVEKYHGTCILLRNKLYLLIAPDGKVVKAALHGFWGTPNKLLQMIKRGTLNYEIKHMNKLRESLGRNLTPFTMERQERSINLLPDEFENLREQVKELGI